MIFELFSSRRYLSAVAHAKEDDDSGYLNFAYLNLPTLRSFLVRRSLGEDGNEGWVSDLEIRISDLFS